MILVTGATGIVGSHIVLELLKSDERVRVLHRSDSDLSVLDTLLSFHSVKARPELVEGSLEDTATLYTAAEGCDTIYHCAALVSFNDNDRQRLIEANTYGTRSVVNICIEKGIKLGYVSSTAAIGDSLKDGERHEESVWLEDKGKAAYTLSKRHAEVEVYRGIEEGLDAVIVNPGIIIGPGNWGQSSTSIFLTGIKGMRFYPAGANGFVDARDVAEITIDLMRSEHEVKCQHLLVGENLSFKEFFDKAAAQSGVKKPSIALSKGLIKMLISTLSLMESLGWRATKVTANSLRSSLKLTRYSNRKILSKGYRLRTIDEALDYTYRVYTT